MVATRRTGSAVQERAPEGVVGADGSPRGSVPLDSRHGFAVVASSLVARERAAGSGTETGNPVTGYGGIW
jgi:hypothetical protein